MQKFSFRPFYISLLLLLFHLHLFGQKQNIRRLVDTLASPDMHGRGYVEKGLEKAAQFIEDEFGRMGVQPVGKSYRQAFKHDVVVFDGASGLWVNDRELQPGVDFVVSPGSIGVKGKKQKLQQLDSVRWIDPALRVVIEKVDKLTWGVATVQDDYTVFYVLKSSLTGDPVTYSANLDARRLQDFTSENIIGMVRGTEKPDSVLVVSAHYDHLGQLGRKAVFHGANDNASGVALMLDLAKQIAARPLRYSVMFVAFAGEEAGLLGSAHYLKNPMLPLNSIRFLINLDLLGTGDEGIMVVNATEFPNEWKMLDDINKQNGWLTQVGQRGKARNSDHYFFTEVGVPSFFIYTLGGIKAYHDVYDLRETLPLTKTEEVGKLILEFFKGVSGVMK